VLEKKAMSTTTGPQRKEEIKKEIEDLKTQIWDLRGDPDIDEQPLAVAAKALGVTPVAPVLRHVEF